MVAPSSTRELLDIIRRSGIHRPERLNDQLRGADDLPADALRAASVLVRRGLLTQFQAKMLLAGRCNGFKLGSYVIREQIGQGGMGIVYLAEHEDLRRRVAVKVLIPPKDQTGTKLAIERFLREARSAAALNHPNIVRIHDVGRHGTVNYLVMDHVEGDTLESLLVKGGALAPSRAVDYVAQAAAGLQHAHEKGFVHRDIKPANIMVDRSGVVKILDMGLARSFHSSDDNLTERLDAGAVVGTADYISPEQALSDSRIDVRADIYSLGATLFALVSGRPPFEGSTAQKLVQHQLKAPPSLTELDPTVPEELAEIVEKMLAKKPDDRYQTPAELIEALAPWLPKGGETKVVAGLAVTTVDSSAALQNARRKREAQSTRRLERRAQRSRRSWPPAAKWAAAGAGALAVLGLILSLTLGGRSASSDPTASEAAPRGPATTGTASTPAKPRTADGPVVYRLDASTVTEFRERYAGIQSVSGRRPPLPEGVRPQCWQKGCEGEFGCESVDAAPALWLTNLTDVTATQYAIELEAGCQCLLEDDQEYTVRVQYRTKGRPDGHVYVQSQKYAHVAGVTLSPSEDQWKVATLKFRRQPNVPVQITVGLKAGGPDTSLFLRFVEVTR
jgi:serine/threonine protein kinase